MADRLFSEDNSVASGAEYHMSNIEGEHLGGQKSFEERFIQEFPIGTVVWEDSLMKNYGITVPGRIYENKIDKHVLVTDVNGIKRNNRLWSAKRVIRKI